MVKKQSEKKSSFTGKLVLWVFTFIIIVGTGVLLYIQFNQDDIDYRPYYTVAQMNEDYLIENQEAIVQELNQDGVDLQRLGHVFIPENPAEYIDIQHVHQHNVPYLNQNDPRWRGIAYGTDGSQEMWENGCAILVLAMIDSYFSNSDVTPREIEKWAGNQYYLDNQGTAWSIYQAFGEDFGYEVVDVGRDFYSAVSLIDQGYVLAVSVGPGTFTLGGHVMVIRGYEDGLVYLNDPNDAPDKLFSIQGIPAQTVIDDALNYWAIRPA